MFNMSTKSYFGTTMTVICQNHVSKSGWMYELNEGRDKTAVSYCGE